MKRALLRFGTLAIFGFLALWLFLWWTAPRINRESYDKIKHGMTKSEVVAILNCKPHCAPGEFKEIGDLALVDIGAMRWRDLEEASYVWKSAECRIHVLFTEKEIVTGTMFYPATSKEPLMQKLRRWLRIE
jgi:hypothetical protein